MLCHPDISLPANYALQIRMSPLSVGWDIPEAMTGFHAPVTVRV